MWKIAAFAALAAARLSLQYAPKGESIMRKVIWCAAVAMIAGSFWLGRLSAAADKPQMRLFELRTYTANEGKLDALNARFRDHTVKLFEKHGMTNVGYWTPIDNKDNKLIYILAYPNREARDRSWAAFGADADWRKAFQEAQANGSPNADGPEATP